MVSNLKALMVEDNYTVFNNVYNRNMKEILLESSEGLKKGCLTVDRVRKDIKKEMILR